MRKREDDLFSQPERGRFGDNESAVRGNDSVRSDLIDLSLVLHIETPAKGTHNQGAVLVSDNGDEVRAQWIPKSQCEVVKNGSYISGRHKDGRPWRCQSVTITLSERLAKEKGLV